VTVERIGVRLGLIEHAATFFNDFVTIFAAPYCTLVVNEMFTAGVLPPNGRATELGSPYIKYKGSCLILAASRHISTAAHPMLCCRDAVKLDPDQRSRLNKSAASATVFNLGCIGVLVLTATAEQIWSFATLRPRPRHVRAVHSIRLGLERIAVEGSSARTFKVISRFGGRG